MSDSLIVSLFEQPGFTAVVSAILGAVVTFLGNYLLQARKAADALRMEKFKLGRSERVEALGEFMALIHGLTTYLDPRKQLITINQFKTIMADRYDGTLELKLAFVGEETTGLINSLDDLYADALYTLYSDESFDRFRMELRKTLPCLVAELRKAVKKELRDIS